MSVYNASILDSNSSGLSIWLLLENDVKKSERLTFQEFLLENLIQLNTLIIIIIDNRYISYPNGVHLHLLCLFSPLAWKWHVS